MMVFADLFSQEALGAMVLEKGVLIKVRVSI